MRALSSVSLANIFDKSDDCVKLLEVDGTISYMNHNGQCAMEIDDFASVHGRAWRELWPESARHLVDDALLKALSGTTARFRTFCPTAKATPKWWDVTVSPVAGESGRMIGCLTVSRDVTVNQQSRNAMAVTAAEMKHRLKNTYQAIASLLIMHGRGNPDTEDFARQMAGRLGAISRAQALFVDDTVPCDLHRLIDDLLDPFTTNSGQIVCKNLPEIGLNQQQADAIALVIGELAVNSCKHGAIAFGGHIVVDGKIEAVGLVITWAEILDKPVERDRRVGGEGLELMRQIMSARDGSFSVDWKNNGPTVALTIPMVPLVQFQLLPG